MRSSTLAGAAATLVVLATSVPSAHAQAPAPARPPATATKPATPAAPAPAAAAPAAPGGAAAAPGAAAAKAAAGTDPVLATVNGEAIHASELQAAAQSLPAELRSMPPQMLYPMLLDQLIDRHAVVIEAQKEGLEKDPDVQQQLARARDTVLQNALLTREVAPKITEAAIRAKYDAEIANKPGEAEVHARHILVPDEAQAKDIIAQLKKGANFEDLAKKYSKDPGAQNGGDLGWFKKGDMVPAFADAAFAMKPNQVSDAPVHTQYGWHVIQVLGSRTAPPVTYEAAHDELRQGLIQADVKQVLDGARAQVQVQKFNPDGTPMSAAASAAPSGPAGVLPGPASPPASQ